eukprot:evm.model.scf_2044.2 EVM.evm.TU.scf_2044.2   scf_2044:21751-25745(+)
MGIDECSLAPDSGPCRAAFQRYHYDPQDGTCKQFIYGGCQGNENNFETPEACQTACGKPTDVCLLGKDTGPCRAAIPRYYYDAQSKRCKRFIYGGCQGNGNNFETRRECRRTCARRGWGPRNCRKRCCNGRTPPECASTCARVSCPAPPADCATLCCQPGPGGPPPQCLDTCARIFCPLPQPPDCGAQCCQGGPISEKCQPTCAVVDCAGPPADCAERCCEAYAGGYDPPTECGPTCLAVTCPVVDPFPPVNDCATRCCDAVNGGYDPPKECLDTCAVVLCAAPQDLCEQECCNAAAGGYDPAPKCLDVCARVSCPGPPAEKCSDAKLCCEAERPAACDELCRRVRVDCRCTAEDCCPTIARDSCRETCATVDCVPQCTPAECCSGTEFCDPASCAAVTCAVDNPGGSPTPPAGCGVFSCCHNGEIDGECEDYCESVDCSLPCCPPIELPGTKPCRDCGLKG